MYIVYYSYTYSTVVENDNELTHWEDGYIQTLNYDDASHTVGKLMTEHGDALDYFCIAKVIEESSLDIPRRTEGAAKDRLPPSALHGV
jgi:hypothetical protein